MELGNGPNQIVSSGLTKETIFLQLAGVRFVGKIILLFARFIVNADHFLSFLCHYVPLL